LPLLSAALTIPFVASQSTFSIVSGQYISRTKRYEEIIWIGYALWDLGSGLVLLFNKTTPRWVLVVCLMVEGAGVGFVFQPTLVAAQAHSTKRDRAVVISVRNVLRSLGGAVGLALSSLVFSNLLKKNLNSITTPLPANYKGDILASILSVPNISILTNTQKEEVLGAYMAGSRGVFIMWLPIMGVCLLLCLLIKDKGLQRPEEKPQVVEVSNSGESDLEMGAQEAPRKSGIAD